MLFLMKVITFFLVVVVNQWVLGGEGVFLLLYSDIISHIKWHDETELEKLCKELAAYTGK